MDSNRDAIGRYKYLPGLLHRVRWAQHFGAIIAEALILIAFLASGMDISMGGLMANNSVMKWAWAAIFSLGVDTSFVISWVRCRQLGRSWHLLWSIPMALGISFVVFEPVVIQLYQQALGIDFSQAISELGINLTILAYARAGVAVALGAILALTNGESSTTPNGATPVESANRPQRSLLWFVKVPQQSEPTIIDETSPNSEQTMNNDDIPAAQVAVNEGQTTPELATVAQIDISTTETPEQRAQQVSEVDLTSLSARERVTKVLELFPDLSDRELGKLSSVAAATAKKHRETLKPESLSAPLVQTQATLEG